MESSTKIFTQFFPNIEKIPLSDMEACGILGTSNASFNRATELGFIKKSVSIHYRYDVSFYFLNMFDIFEYALRRDFFFLGYGCQPEVSELILSLVDEFTFIIDNCIYTSSCPQIDHIKEDVISSCMENSEKWNEYWLYEGEPFSATKCSTIALRTWSEIFEKIRILMDPPVCGGVKTGSVAKFSEG